MTMTKFYFNFGFFILRFYNIAYCSLNPDANLKSLSEDTAVLKISPTIVYRIKILMLLSRKLYAVYDCLQKNDVLNHFLEN